MKKPSKKDVLTCCSLFLLASYSIAITPYAYRSIKSDARQYVLNWASKQKDLKVFGSKASELEKASEALPTGIIINYNDLKKEKTNEKTKTAKETK